jgi:hypothetical protein
MKPSGDSGENSESKEKDARTKQREGADVEIDPKGQEHSRRPKNG